MELLGTNPQGKQKAAWTILKILGLIAVGIASKIWIEEVSNAFVPHEGRPPVLIGIGMIAVLIGGFGGLFWWLYLSPLKATVTPDMSDAAHKRRRLVGTFMVLSSVTFCIAGIWDALWHVWKGGFGNDFLWPPHILLYGSLLVSALVGGVVLGRIVLGRGDPRVRARQEPALGIVALASAYQICSLPSDLIWHQIYGIDISAWSLPHFLIVSTTTIVAIASTGLLLTSLAPGEKNRWVRLGVIILMSCAQWIPLLMAAPEVEWGPMALGHAFWLRPGWVYPLSIYIVGMVCSLLVLSLTEQVGAATAVSLLVFVWRLGEAGAASTIPITANLRIASHAFLIVPAIAIDLAYWRLRKQQNLTTRQRMFRAGLVYWLVYWPVAFIVTASMGTSPAISAIDVIVGIALGLAFLLVFGIDVPAVARGLRGERAGSVTTGSQSASPVMAAGDR